MKTLIVTEKPKVAERIAKSLGKSVKKQFRNKVPYYEVGENIVAPAVGHIYGLKEKNAKWTYPVFDIEWVPAYEVNEGSSFTKGYLNNLKFLAKKCGKFINACDFDIEGSVIGFNAIKYACNVDPFGENVYRMKFSTITKDAIIRAYENLDPIQREMVNAGLARHTLDWYWGINLSRALTTSIKKAGRYVTLSIGRVQGPALKILAGREKEIRAFVTEPYWEIEQIAKENKNNKKISSLHEKGKFKDEKEAKEVKEKCGDKTTVSKVVKKKFKHAPPHPFDLTTLQTEAYKQLKVDPRKTLEIAQDLYTSGFISYPRTSSQQLPDDINFREILTKLSKNENYEHLCEMLLSKEKLAPNNGKKTDPAHPAIHPTGEKAKGLSAENKKIYDLIVHRFLAAFGDFATRETVKILFDNNSEIFVAKGTRTTDPGWHILYGKYAKFEEEELPKLEEGEVLDVIEIKIHAKETKPPKRYTPASIIREMEKNNLGTKATRSQIIDILFKRNYVDGRSLEVTQLGLDVVETMDKFCPEVMSIDLTRKFEDEMKKISVKDYTSEKVLVEGREMVTKISAEFKENELKIGKALAESVSETSKKQNVVGKCKDCGGDLMLRQGKYGNFIGCGSYPKCKFTMSLPQGMIKKEGECEECGNAMVVRIIKGKRPWKFCINPNCGTRKEAEEKRKAFKEKYYKGDEKEKNKKDM
ncbi:DNA topoisomerase I [Candidatus Altiarchaeales archaeon WOR_SM1_SCG]|nr:DNA topoisomerase I [Candidatus Altiarchaeales archaeon WOR_SM1_SCG]